MHHSKADFHVRKATPSDSDTLLRILNEIISIGGTTALEAQLTPSAFDNYFLTGPNCIVCFVVETSKAHVVGFQSLTRNADLPDAWADIATFTQRSPRMPGAGAALFKSTLAFALDVGLAAINATIRADNYAGIPYYEKLGFKTYKVTRGVPLTNGTPVDRISKRYDV